MDHSHVSAAKIILAFGDRCKNVSRAVRRGKGDGRRSEACRHGHLRRPSGVGVLVVVVGGRRRGRKKKKHQLLYRDVFFTFASDRTRSVDLPDGLTAAGVAILSTQGDETEMETVHNTPRDTVQT